MASLSPSVREASLLQVFDQVPHLSGTRFLHSQNVMLEISTGHAKRGG